MGILRHTGSNLGHFTALQIGMISEIDSIQINFQRKVIHPIVMKTDKQLIDVYTTDKTLQASSMIKSKKGIYYHNEVKCFVPKHRHDVLEKLEKMARDGVVCILTDADGNQWLLGNQQEPMQLTFKAPLSGKAGYNITITGESLYSAIPYAPI